jgi:methyl-accepting chemotaxis protein
MRSSLKTKLICGCLVILLIPSAIVFAIVYSEFSRQAYADFTKSSTRELKQAGRAVATFLSEAKLNADLMAVQPALLELTPDSTSYVQTTSPTKPHVKEGDAPGAELMRFFGEVRKTHPNYIKAYVGTKQGAFIISSQDDMPAGYDPRARPWYAEAQASPDKALLSKAYKDVKGQPMISATKAYRGPSGQPEGAVAIDITLSKLTEIIKNIKLGQTGWVIMVQADGTIISNPKAPETNFKNISEFWNGKLAEVRDTDLEKADGEVEVEAEGKAYLVSAHTDPDTGWKYLGLIEKKELVEPVRRTVGTLALVMGVGLVVMGLAIWLFADRLVIRPLKRVESFLGAVAGGDYNRREQHLRGDEIGNIFNALNKTATQLGENMREIEARTQEAQDKAQAAERSAAEADEARQAAIKAKQEGLLTAATRLEAVVAHVSSASEELAGQSAAMGQSTATQKERITETATAMEEMNATVLEVAKNASHAAQGADQAKSLAETGNQVVGRSVSAMEDLLKLSLSLKGNMNDLGERARAIDQIMNVINDIADQTNLLALNAAIEAARAGEAGRGFAVVADEVRKLAEKTMSATKEVGETIRGIQEVSAQNIKAMEAAGQAIEDSTSLVRQSGKALNQIVEMSENTALQVQSIATAAEQQSAASQEINQSVDQINVIATENAQSMRQTELAIQELAEQADQLRGLVAILKFEGSAEAQGRARSGVAAAMPLAKREGTKPPALLS